MLTRRLIIGATLLLQVAISLLGNAGMHCALGCRHDHGEQKQCSHSHTPVKHSACRCKHSRASEQTAPVSKEQAPIAPPTSHDDCAICQFFARPVEVTAEFQWTLSTELIDLIAVDIVWQSAVEFALPYEVRGPPVLS